jgi:hypothetical protein
MHRPDVYGQVGERVGYGRGRKGQWPMTDRPHGWRIILADRWHA